MWGKRVFFENGPSYTQSDSTMIAKWPSSYPKSPTDTQTNSKLTQTWPQSNPKVPTKSPPHAASAPKVNPKWRQSAPKAALNAKSDHKVTPKLPQSHHHMRKVIPKWPQSRLHMPKVTPKWSQSDPKVTYARRDAKVNKSYRLFPWKLGTSNLQTWLPACRPRCPVTFFSANSEANKGEKIRSLWPARNKSQNNFGDEG